MLNIFLTHLIFREYSAISPEVASFASWVQNAAIIGCATGSIIHSKNQYMDFMENAEASRYKSHLDAKADLSNRMIKGSIRGASIWGVRSVAVAATYG